MHSSDDLENTDNLEAYADQSEVACYDLNRKLTKIKKAEGESVWKRYDQLVRLLVHLQLAMHRARLTDAEGVGNRLHNLIEDARDLLDQIEQELRERPHLHRRRELTLIQGGKK